ncbi:MAG: hypothetical protein ABR499_04725 [Gemmatimonadaceae bacterium]
MRTVAVMPQDSRASRRPPSAARPAFTLAEVVVALVLLAWGALALVASSAAAIRTVAAAEAETFAVAAARDRVERLATGGCSRLRDGLAVDSSRGIRERWTIGPSGNGARLVTDSVEYLEHSTQRQAVVQRLVLC